MKTNEFDELFKVEGGVPIIAGLYIGMDADEIEEKLEDLNSYKTEQSSDYPIISKYSISFEYDLFDSEYLVKRIGLVFPRECTKNDSDFLLDYLSQKIYHEKVHKDIETDTAGNLLSLNVEISNYYYSCSFFNRDGQFIIQLSGVVLYPELYKAFYTTGKNPDLKAFIHKSLYYCNNESSKDKALNKLFPVYNGYPIICGVYLGCETGSSSEAEAVIDEELHNPALYNLYQDYEDISFEVLIDVDNRVDEIIMTFSEEDKDIALRIINYLKQRLLIEDADYYIEDFEDRDFIINANMSNEYLSVMVKNPYRNLYGCHKIEIIIETTKKDQSELYKTLMIMLDDNTHYGYFKAADDFYKDYSNARVFPYGVFDTYEEAIESFQGD